MASTNSLRILQSYSHFEETGCLSVLLPQVPQESKRKGGRTTISEELSCCLHTQKSRSVSLDYAHFFFCEDKVSISNRNLSALSEKWPESQSLTSSSITLSFLTLQWGEAGRIHFPYHCVLCLSKSIHHAHPVLSVDSLLLSFGLIYECLVF